MPGVVKISVKRNGLIATFMVTAGLIFGWQIKYTKVKYDVT